MGVFSHSDLWEQVVISQNEVHASFLPSYGPLGFRSKAGETNMVLSDSNFNIKMR